MSNDNSTTFEAKVDILAELWIDYKHDQDLKEFIEHNDIGLPLAYVIYKGIVESTEEAGMFIEESFDAFLAGLGRKDEGFETLDDIFGGI